MQYIFSLAGLDCPNCGVKIEKASSELEEIKSAHLNFINSKLTIETYDSYQGDIYRRICDIVHRYEEDVEVIYINDSNSSSSSRSSLRKYSLKHLCLLIGIFAYIILLISDIIFDLPLVLKQNNLPWEIYLFMFLAVYIPVGYDVIYKAIRNILHGVVFDENSLMVVATIGALVIGEYKEAVAVIIFYRIGEYFQERMVERSKQSISDLMNLNVSFARVITDGEIGELSPEVVKVGQTILIRPGEMIPLDGIVTKGSSMVDISSLTGESVPKNVKDTDQVYSGCINLTGVLNVEVTSIYSESTASKILSLVENSAARKATIETFITKFARYYTPIVVVLALLVSVLPSILFNQPFTEWLRRGLIFLVVSCPCALVLSIPLSFYSGIGATSKHGVLVKGGNYLHGLNHLQAVVFDKTGTLTKGVFEVHDILPVKGITKNELLRYTAYSEAHSNHPIAVSIVTAYSKEIDEDMLSKHFEEPGYGVGVEYNGTRILSGSYEFMRSNSIPCEEIETIYSAIYVAVNGSYIGAITLSDSVKEDSRDTVSFLKKRGIEVYMLTGDRKEAALAIADNLGIEFFSSELLPNHKVDIIEELISKKSKGKNIAFVGDGLNDAPSITRADIGIAMGGLGSDASIEAADIVLMSDETSKLNKAISIATFTRRIVLQNIILALSVKLTCIVLATFGLVSMQYAVFADVGVALLAVANSIRIMRTKNT